MARRLRPRFCMASLSRSWVALVRPLSACFLLTVDPQDIALEWSMTQRLRNRRIQVVYNEINDS